MRAWVYWVIAALIVVLLLVYLSSRVGEQTLVQREQPVNIDELAK